MYFDPVSNNLWSQKETLDFQWTGTAHLPTDVSNTTVLLTSCRKLEAGVDPPGDKDSVFFIVF